MHDVQIRSGTGNILWQERDAMRRIGLNRESARLRVCFAGCVIIFVEAATSAFSVFVEPLIEATRASQAQVTFAYSLYHFSMVFAGAVAGKVADRYGPRPLMYLGGALYGLGWALTACADSLPMLYGVFGIMAGTGTGMMYTPVIMTCLRWYPDKPGSITGVLLATASVGTLTIAKLGALLCHHFGISALVYLGIAYLIAIWSVGWLMAAPPAGWRPGGRNSGAAVLPGAADDLRPGEMIRTGMFWFMLILLALAATAGVMMVGMLSPIVQTQLGLSPIDAATMVSVNSLANLGGRLSLGRLCDTWGERRTLALIFLMSIVSLLGMERAASIWVFTLFLILLGFFFGGVLVVFPPLTAKMFGVSHSAGNYGILFFGYACGTVLGTQIASRTVDPALGAHAYSPGFLLAAGVSALGLVLCLFFLKMRGPRTDREQEQ